MLALAVDAIPGSPRVVDVTRPEPAADEVLVSVESSSINGFDAATAAGYLHGMMEHRFPLVLGKDFAGTVTAVGSDVEAFVVGDAVFGVAMKPFLGTGTLAEHVTLTPGYGIARRPAGVSAIDAGALGLAGTAAVDSLDALALKAEETLLISGATGGVGGIALQLAAARGVRVIATAAPGREGAYVIGLAALRGADAAIVDGDVAEQVRQLVPAGVDAVLHLAGDGPTLTGLLRPGGRIASTVGLTADTAERNDVMVHTIMADPKAAVLGDLAARVEAGELQVPVSAVFPLERAAEAFDTFSAGALGKIAITVP